MVSQPIDRDMVFGLVALHMRLIDRGQLVDALEDWVKEKTRTLAQVLEGRGSLTGEQSTLVDAAVEGEIDDDDEFVETRLQKFLADDTSSPPAVRGTASRYQVLWAHAKGGLGEVFLAEDTELHRRVALKEIQARHAKNPLSRSRFVAEAEITGNLEHPGVVPVYGLGNLCGRSAVLHDAVYQGRRPGDGDPAVSFGGRAEFHGTGVPLASAQARSTYVTRLPTRTVEASCTAI